MNTQTEILVVGGGLLVVGAFLVINAKKNGISTNTTGGITDTSGTTTSGTGTTSTDSGQTDQTLQSILQLLQQQQQNQGSTPSTGGTDGTGGTTVMKPLNAYWLSVQAAGHTTRQVMPGESVQSVISQEAALYGVSASLFNVVQSGGHTYVELPWQYAYAHALQASQAS